MLYHPLWHLSHYRILYPLFCHKLICYCYQNEILNEMYSELNQQFLFFLLRSPLISNIQLIRSLQFVSPLLLYLFQIYIHLAIRYCFGVSPYLFSAFHRSFLSPIRPISFVGILFFRLSLNAPALYLHVFPHDIFAMLRPYV